MGKKIGWSAGAVAFASASILAIFGVQEVKMPLPIFWGLVSIFLICLVIGLYVLLPSLYRKFLMSVSILNGWRCIYWTKEKQVQVTFWFNDYSESKTFNISCTADFDSQKVKLNDNVNIGGIYMGEQGLQDEPIMVECLKRDVELNAPDKAVVTITIKPTGGIWLKCKKTNKVNVQVINND